jgi:SAM-dependent methyltransferase
MMVKNNKSVSKGPVHHLRANCRLCGGRDLERAFSLTPTPPANACVAGDALQETQETFPLGLYFCQECKHLQLLDIVDPGVLFRDYVYVSGTSSRTIEHFQAYVEQVIERAGLKPGDLVVEIGSNDGTVLSFFKQAGMRVLGIDPARDIAAQATRDGVETLSEFFTPELAMKLRDEYGPAAAICANNVFAHIDDLVSVVEGIRRLLAPEGQFVFEVSYLLDVYTKTLFDTMYHEHLDYHRVGPLRRFFKTNGMALHAALRVPSQGGSLRGYARLADGTAAIEDSVEDLIALERNAGLDDPQTFRDFASQIDQKRVELTALIKGLRSAGKTVAGYGAPAKATTLMYHFGLDIDSISFIVDDNPLKHNLFSPGLHIPILPVEELYSRRPDYAVVLAWNFADSIIENHSQYTDEGGRFIVPLPNLLIK